MVQNQTAPTNNNPNSETQKQYKEPVESELTEEVVTRFTPEEREYYETFTRIISKLKLADNVKIVKDETMSSLVRTSMAFMTNWYTGTAFRDSNLAGMLPDLEAKKEFIAFRKKYMNFPINAQLEELKRLGYVKQKE